MPFTEELVVVVLNDEVEELPSLQGNPRRAIGELREVVAVDLVYRVPLALRAEALDRDREEVADVIGAVPPVAIWDDDLEPAPRLEDSVRLDDRLPQQYLEGSVTITPAIN